MKRWVITVSTDWCGMENEYRAEAENQLDLEEDAEELAYDNWTACGCEEYVLDELGYDYDNMTDDLWKIVENKITSNPSWYYTIEEFNGSEEEWEDLSDY